MKVKTLKNIINNLPDEYDVMTQDTHCGNRSVDIKEAYTEGDLLILLTSIVGT